MLGHKMMAFCFRKTYVLAILLTEKKKKSKKKKVLGKKAEDLEILTYCHRNWNFSIADILLILFAWLRKYHCLSTCFYLYFYHGMLELLHHTSINTFVLQLLFVPSLLFPFFNLVFQVFLQWSLFEMEWNEIYSFFFFKQLWCHAFTFKYFNSFKFMWCYKAYNNKI